MVSYTDPAPALVSVALTDITVVDVSAGPTDPATADSLETFDHGKITPKIEFSLDEIRTKGKSFSLQAGAEITTSSITARTLIAVSFEVSGHSSTSELSESELGDLIGDYAFPNLLPYIRANFHVLFGLLGEKPPTLPILQPGQIQVQIQKEDTATDTLQSDEDD